MASAVQFLYFVVVVPVLQGVLRTGGSGRSLLQFVDKCDVLGGVLAAEGGGSGRRF